MSATLLPATDASEKLQKIKHDKLDPNPWLALYVDSSIPISQIAKANLLVDVSSWSREFFLPLIRPFCRLTLCIFKIFKTFAPNSIQAVSFLHKTIYWGLKNFVSPYANLLILRHFNIGSELLVFIAQNTKGVTMELNPLRPKTLHDLLDNVFYQHDLNIFNFIIEFNRQLNEKELDLEAIDELDYSAITDDGFGIEPLPTGKLNVIDLETAIEIYTPMYQLLLTDSDFWRACNSLQLDETIALYATTLIGDHKFLGLVNNRHPIVPESMLGTAHRLMLHGLAAESLHAYLVKQKRKHALTEKMRED
jgi:hypothetical protein